MKLLHLSDLHIGRRLGTFSFIDDQRFILDRIIDIVKENTPDGVMIAGDIYDRSVPSEEAVALFDDFLCKLSEVCGAVFIISGNHDSAERLSFGERLVRKNGVYISPVFDGKISPVTLKDRYGEVDIYMLPFVKPVYVKQFYPDSEIKNYTDAVETVIENAAPDRSRRNVMIAHQFVTGAEEGGSEERAVGGLENVDAAVFEPFDYTALGHIHRSQNVGKNIRYCGSPLKYSFAEVKHEKTVTMVELKEKGSVEVTELPLAPMRDMIELKGCYDEIMSAEPSCYADKYLRVILTDTGCVYNAFNSLLERFPHLMKMEYENLYAPDEDDGDALTDDEINDPVSLFESFYLKRTGESMNDEQLSYIAKLAEELWGGAV